MSGTPATVRVGDAVITATPNASVSILVEGEQCSLDQALLLAGLTGQDQEWLAAAVLLHAWDQHTPAVDPDTALALAQGSRAFRSRFATDPALRPLLAHDRTWQVRAAVASLLDLDLVETDRPLLDLLAADPDPAVRYEIAGHRHCPAPVRAALAAEAHPDVRARALEAMRDHA